MTSVIRKTRDGTLLIAASLLATASSASVVQAQGSLRESSRLLEGYCFRGQPLPACKAFWIGEFGYGYWLNPEPGWGDRPLQPFGRPTGFGRHLTWDLGWMVNLNRRSAVGGTAHFGNHGEDAFESVRFGLKARYRYWLGSNVSLEASPGILLYDFDASDWTAGFTGHVAVNLGDLIAVSGSLDAFDGRESWTIGGRTGSIVSVIPFMVYAPALVWGCLLAWCH